jgi:NADPH-dependent curcumin reductase CurA
MAPVSNPVVIFNEIPKGAPNDNTLITKTDDTIDLDAPLDGGFLVKTLCFSLDPYQRGKMRDSSIKSYTDAYEIGKP